MNVSKSKYLNTAEIMNVLAEGIKKEGTTAACCLLFDFSGGGAGAFSLISSSSSSGVFYSLLKFFSK